MDSTTKIQDGKESFSQYGIFLKTRSPKLFDNFLSIGFNKSLRHF